LEDKVRAGTEGFVFIELVVVISIIGILAAIAIPNFYSYRIRAFRADADTLAIPAQRKIEAFYGHVGRFPRDNREAGLLPGDKIKSNYVASLEVENGAIHLTFSQRAPAEIAGQIVSLRPSVLKTNRAAPILWLKQQDDDREMAGRDRTTLNR
jgi:type IV pilus assembly protein PilA